MSLKTFYWQKSELTDRKFHSGFMHFRLTIFKTIFQLWMGNLLFNLQNLDRINIINILPKTKVARTLNFKKARLTFPRNFGFIFYTSCIHCTFVAAGRATFGLRLPPRKRNANNQILSRLSKRLILCATSQAFLLLRYSQLNWEIFANFPYVLALK